MAITAQATLQCRRRRPSPEVNMVMVVSGKVARMTSEARDLLKLKL